MTTKIYGIVAAENFDSSGEKILLDGLKDELKFIRDEHSDLSAFRILGPITYSKKIYNEKDCENDKQLRCWNYVKVPFLYAEGELADDEDHPNAKAAAALLRFVSQKNVPLKLGFSVDGGILERRTLDGRITESKEEGRILSKTLAMSAALTVKPCNQKLSGGIFLENDLAKSSAATEPPTIYWEYLKKSAATSSFNDILVPELHLSMLLESLKKSLEDYFSAFTDLKCHHCGSAVRLFKSTANMPNACEKCGNSYSINQIWNALNK